MRCKVSWMARHRKCNNH